jgi:hypothetical protein
MSGFYFPLLLFRNFGFLFSGGDNVVSFKAFFMFLRGAVVFFGDICLVGEAKKN